MRRKLLVTSFVLAALAIVLSVAAVSADSQRAFAGRLIMTGDQEVIAGTCAPPQVCGDPDAIGTAIVQVVPALDRVCFKLDWQGIDGTVWGAHIHGPSTTQTAANVVVPLFMRNPADASTHFSGTDSTSGCTTSATWADQIAADPASFYVNVHSTVYGPGAIRAQLAD